MVDDVKKDFASIKAGVDGKVADIPPAPSMDMEIPAAPAMEAPAAPVQEMAPQPDAIITEDSGGYQDITPAMEAPAAPSFDSGPSSNPSMDIEKMHEIIESIVSEKWDDYISHMGDLSSWKQKIEINLLGTKQEVVRLNNKLESLQNSVLGKVGEYDKTMKDVHSEMRALGKVFEKILEPLTTNIKELGKISQDMKKHRK